MCGLASEGDSLGIGLGITGRLMDDVAIRPHPGWGTVVMATRFGTDTRVALLCDKLTH